jgi:predicted transcriptional regulator YheO
MNTRPTEPSALQDGYSSAPNHKYARRTVDGERLVAVFSSLVEPIGRTLPSSSEVVLHDLSLLPNSIVAVHGNVTGRRLGDPATDLLLERAVAGFDDHYVGYETQLPDGRKLRSSTMIIRDVAGNPVAALCINTDLSSWITVHRIVSAMIAGTSDDVSLPTLNTAQSPVPVLPTEYAAPTDDDAPAETFVRDVDELAALLINQAIKTAEVPVKLMKKEHKLQVVRDLKARGMFLLRDAVEMIAESLDVSRFTIYNYLNEIADEEGTETLSDAPASRGRKRKAPPSHD